jgi:hypothetical protein
MDLFRIIRQLHEEKNFLDDVISSLESLVAAEQISSGESPSKRRGRRSMSREERLEVSRRMKKYWRARRSERNAG